MPLPQISLPIVGIDHPNQRGVARRFELAVCQRGEQIELRPEPENPADEHAVAVYSCRGVQLGYIPSGRAVRIGQLMRRGTDLTAMFQDHTRFWHREGWQQGAVIRVAFDEMPVLPEPQEAADREPEWYPDEEWPE